MEHWKPIFSGRYEVSNLGRIRYKETGRIRRTDFPSSKYCLINARVNGGAQKQYLVHRIVAEAFLEKPEGCDFVNHKNGIKKDNRVDNLEWCTRQQNEDHAFKTGLKNSTGSNNTMSKLDENKVEQIKKLLKHKSNKEIAQKFGVHRVTICRIRNGKIWTHV